MYGFGGNFLAGLILGALLAALAPFADLALGLTAPPASTNEISVPQSVNRAAKSDRLHHPVRATRDGDRTPVRATREDDNVKPAKIPVGCDPAFSPLSRGAGGNFSRRCLA